MSTNTLTGFIPIMYKGLDIVSRELCGLSRAVSLDSGAESVAKGQTVRSFIVPEATHAPIEPGVYPSDTGGQDIGYTDMTITDVEGSPIAWTGNEQLEVNGILNPIMVNQFAQSVRVLVNLIEADLAKTGYKGASRAYGTAGTTPFGTAGDFSDFAQILKILDDNGAPQTDRQLGLDSAAIASIRGKQSGLFEVNRAGNEDLLRRGVVGDVENLAIHNSAQIQKVTASIEAAYVVNNSSGPYAVGTTSIALDGAGTGDAVVAGDIITFAGDANKYVVKTGITGAAGTIVINKPGLLQTLADGVASTLVENYTANLGFARSALHLVARQPVMPVDINGSPADSARDVTTITDLMSGLTFQVALYALYRKIKYEVGIAWGTAVIKPEHICILLG